MNELSVYTIVKFIEFDNDIHLIIIAKSTISYINT